MNRIPKTLPDNSYVVLDIELFGAELHKLHRPTGEFACLSWCTEDDSDVITDVKVVDLLMGRVENCVLVFHNAEFDIQHIRRWAQLDPQSIWCTMLMERILYSGYYDRFSLKDLVRRYLNRHLDKEVRDQFKNATELTPELIQYSIDDACLTYKVFEAQQERVKQNRWAFKIWKEIDMPSIWAYQDFQGFRLDIEHWAKMAKDNESKAKELKESFDFNPASPKQVKEVLRKAGFQALPSTGVAVLEKYISRKPNSSASVLAQRVLDFRKVSKLASTYGMNIIDKYVEVEDDYYVVRSNIRVTGASTGRNSSRDPNMQNIPVREHPIFRLPWIARPGNKLLIADYASQEPRISAHLTQDKNLIDIFRSGRDPYSEVARRVHGMDVKKGDPFRENIKTDFLAASYGQRPRDDEHAERLHKFFKYFPDLENWCFKQRNKTDYVESVMGRRFWANPYSSKMQTNNLNHPHQATATDMMKMAIVKMHKNWDFDCPFGVVIPVHDEVILDVPKDQVEEISKFVEDCMVSVAEKMCPSVPFIADVHVGNSWSDK